MTQQWDVLIAGGGVIGASIARELSRYDLKTALVEANSDLALGTSGANSGIVHAGYDAVPGTLMAELNVRGNAMYPELCSKLEIPFEPIGSLVLAFDEDDEATIRKLYERGQVNGVPDLQILGAEEVKAMEPHVTGSVRGALYAPTAGVVSPYEATIAIAENAAENGVSFYLEHPVTAVRKTEEGFVVTAGGEEFCCRILINCCGVHANELSRMAGGEPFEVTGRKGEYILYDKNLGGYVSHVLFQPPSKMGKGILVTQTAEGNMLIGPAVSTSKISTTPQRPRMVWMRCLRQHAVPVRTCRQAERSLPLPACVPSSVTTSSSGIPISWMDCCRQQASVPRA